MILIICYNDIEKFKNVAIICDLKIYRYYTDLIKKMMRLT